MSLLIVFMCRSTLHPSIDTYVVCLIQCGSYSYINVLWCVREPNVLFYIYIPFYCIANYTDYTTTY